MLIDHPEGQYRFLQGIEPYSCGVVANSGYEIVFVTLTRPIAWREGFRRVEVFLENHRLELTALCGLQLRSPAPYTMKGFIDFNRGYCEILKERGLWVGELNPIARTNVAPKIHPPAEPELFGFAYVRKARESSNPTFLVAGAGEVREGILEEERILRRGETTSEALVEKARYVMHVMAERLAGLTGDWGQVNRINVYTVHPLDELLPWAVLPGLNVAVRSGVCCFSAHPPIQQIEFEMDLRGVRNEWFLDL